MNQIELLLGLGGNLDDPPARLSQARDLIESHVGFDLLKQSDCWRSRAWGVEDQADFANAALLVRTALSPLQVLLVLHELEHRMGRRRLRHWGERIIDLDILCSAGPSITSACLQIPHPWLLHRDFALFPAAQLAPDWRLAGKTLAEWARASDNSLLRWPPERLGTW